MKTKFVWCILAAALFSTSSFAQNKTVTNEDLEKYKQKRLQAEEDYNRQVENGNLPSREELEKRQQERRKFLSEFSQQVAIKKRQAADYWQSQAFALRTEIAAVEAEINYLRARANEISAPQVYYGIGYLPYGGFGYPYGGVGFPQFPINGTNKVVVANGGIGGNVSFGGRNARVTIGGGFNQTSIRQSSNVAVTGNNLGAGQTNLTFGRIPYTPGILAVPFTLPTAQNFTREELFARLRLLEQTRAGLYARFSVLEDEARRSGVRIE